MKVALVFILLFGTVLCRPVRKFFGSSDSSEEVKRRPAVPAFRIKAAVVPQNHAAPVQNVAAAAAAVSDESTETSEEEEVSPQAALDVTSDAFFSDKAPVNGNNSEDNEEEDDDNDDDDDDENETEDNEDESSNTSESGESSTLAPTTATPVMVTEEPVAETTPELIQPTIVTDNGRGDSLGGQPDEYKTFMYVEDKSYHKYPASYKSNEYVGMGKKMAYDRNHDNEVEKSLQVYKVQALQVHSDVVEEDTSTPDMESQGLDTSSSSQGQDLNQEEGDNTSASDATTSESGSSSSPEEEEEEEESTTTANVNTSEESEDEESQSSEEATGGADDSDESENTESNSDEDGKGPDNSTDAPVVVTAK